MSAMDGNPHFEEGNHDNGSDNYSLAQATMALAYEQRTANLIAAFGNMMDGETDTFLGERIDGYELAKQIQNRLGL